MDTATKRYSAINVGSPWRGILPPPDGDIDAGDRQIVPFLYSGILAGEAAPEPQPQPQPQPQQQPAGGVYAPARKRKPERLVFLEREILEKRKRERERVQDRQRLDRESRRVQVEADSRELDRRMAAVAQQRARIEAEIQELQTAIAAIQQQIAFEIELQQQIEQDEDDAIAVILMAATLH